MSADHRQPAQAHLHHQHLRRVPEQRHAGALAVLSLQPHSLQICIYMLLPQSERAESADHGQPLHQLLSIACTCQYLPVLWQLPSRSCHSPQLWHLAISMPEPFAATRAIAPTDAHTASLQKAVDAVQGGADQRAALEDLFYTYGVDITFCGHVHWQGPLAMHLLA